MARCAGALGKSGALAQATRAPGDLDEAQAEGVPAAGAGRADAAPTVEAAAPALVEALRVDLLQRMTAMVAALPGGYYTEIKGNLTGADGAPLVGTFKLRDFAASLKDLAAIGKGLGGPDIEDMGPVMGLVYGDDDEDDDEDGD